MSNCLHSGIYSIQPDIHNHTAQQKLMIQSKNAVRLGWTELGMNTTRTTVCLDSTNDIIDTNDSKQTVEQNCSKNKSKRDTTNICQQNFELTTINEPGVVGRNANKGINNKRQSRRCRSRYNKRRYERNANRETKRFREQLRQRCRTKIGIEPMNFKYSFRRNIRYQIANNEVTNLPRKLKNATIRNVKSIILIN